MPQGPPASGLLDSMHEPMNPNSALKTGSRCPDRQHFFTQIILPFCLALRITSSASENVPHRPFAQWADVPERGQFVFGVVYQESEAYRIWAGRDFHDITVKSGGESYGIDINQGYLAMQYGLTEKWAADFNIGATTVGWRKFDTNNGI